MYRKKKTLQRGSLDSAITEEEIELHNLIFWFWFS
jgi:hypothetical protein